MRCSRAQRKLEAYLGGETGERERARLERHLAGCERCSRALERARQSEGGRCAAPGRSGLPGASTRA